jgi:hypothetical protein
VVPAYNQEIRGVAANVGGYFLTTSHDLIHHRQKPDKTSIVTLVALTFTTDHTKPMMDDFLPHRLHPVYERDLTLYHVYDELSQTPYIHGYGIEAGDKNRYYIRYRHRITVPLIAKHLDRYQDEPTSFISLFDSPNNALREAQGRMSHRYVYRDGQSYDRGFVFVALISARQLADEGVFFFSAQDLRRMLGGGTQQLDGILGAREWFAMDYIPDTTVAYVVEEDDLRMGVL